MLSLKNIHKSIKDKSIISDINLSLPLGSINGLLGPNGAGKTTTCLLYTSDAADE